MSDIQRGHIVLRGFGRGLLAGAALGALTAGWIAVSGLAVGSFPLLCFIVLMGGVVGLVIGAVFGVCTGGLLALGARFFARHLWIAQSSAALGAGLIVAAFGCLTASSATVLILFAIGAYAGSDSAVYAVTGRPCWLRA